jgi:hypothetical protein
MKKRRNIVSIDFNEQELQERFDIVSYKKDNRYPRFPNIICLDNINELKRQEGFMLIIFLDLIPELYFKCDENPNNFDALYEFDRLNRNKFNNFEYVVIYCTDDFFDKSNYKSIHSNIMFKSSLYRDGVYKNKLDIYALYEKYLNKKDIKLTNIKRNNIDRLKKCVDKQKDYFTSEDIMKKLNVSHKWVKRYMKDMNEVYNNIGYSYSRKMWYKVKKQSQKLGR